MLSRFCAALYVNRDRGCPAPKKKSTIKEVHTTCTLKYYEAIWYHFKINMLVITHWKSCLMAFATVHFYCIEKSFCLTSNNSTEKSHQKSYIVLIFECTILLGISKTIRITTILLLQNVGKTNHISINFHYILISLAFFTFLIQKPSHA